MKGTVGWGCITYSTTTTTTTTPTTSTTTTTIIDSTILRTLIITPLWGRKKNVSRPSLSRTGWQGLTFD